VRVDVKRRRIDGEQAEHRIVHLGDRSAERVMEFLTDIKFLEIQTRR
jgi:hypothetical protein